MEMMKGRKMVGAIVVMVGVVASMFGGTRADGLCNMNADGLNACQPAVTAPNPPPPTQLCCDAMKGADLQCFCDYKNNNSFLLSALGIDPDLAMQLPAKCNIPSPPTC